MAIVKQRIYQKWGKGEKDYKVVHIETSSDIVMRPNGTTSVEDSLTKIENTKINGIPIGGLKDGEDLSNFAECNTSGGTVKKEVTVPGMEVVSGTEVTILFEHGNTATNPTLSVNGKDYPIRLNGLRPAGPGSWKDGEAVRFVFIDTGNDTGYWCVVGGSGGSGNISYSVCSTAAATAAKTVALIGFVLETEAQIAVKFTNANTVANPTLNVNNTGAKPICKYGTTPAGDGAWTAGEVITLVYDGSVWLFSGETASAVDNYINAPYIPVLSADPTNPKTGQIWIVT